MRASLIVGGVVIGLVTGFLAGGVRPRIEAAELRDELTKSQEQLKRRGRSSSSPSRFMPIPGLGNLGQTNEAGGTTEEVPEKDREERPRRRWWSPPRERQEPSRSQEPQDQNKALPSSDSPAKDESTSRREGFQAAIEVQKVRAQQSRAALKEKAKLNDEQLARVDEVVLKMNKELAPFADQLLKLASADQEPQPLEMLFVSQEVSSILYKGQSEFEATVGPEPLEAVDEPSKQIWNYVDLEMFQGAAETLRARREARDGGAPFAAPGSSAAVPAPSAPAAPSAPSAP